MKRLRVPLAVTIAAISGPAAAIGVAAAAPPAEATPVNVSGGCVVVNSSAVAPSDSCSFDASSSFGYQGYTDTGYALYHYERVPVYDSRGCTEADAGGKLETQVVRVYDAASNTAGQFNASYTFAPGVTYVAVMKGDGDMSAGNVDPNGDATAPSTITPLDRTHGVTPGECFSPLTSAIGTVSHGLTMVGYEQLDPRLSELTFETPDVIGDTGVRVLTPAGMDWSGRTRYPVLYLLHGASGNETDWTVQGNAEQITAGAKVIVVMPASGAGDGYTNWYNGGAGGPPEWESYHIDQLLPWIDAHYPTVGTRAGRAIAGLSMGGGGAMHYAARHPDLFAAAAAFSGAVDLENPTMRADGEPDELRAPDGYGDWATNRIQYAGHNPVELAENLRGLWLGLWTGNGMPGGPCSSCSPYDGTEYTVHQENIHLDSVLNGLGIAHLFDDYGPGSHAWYYWQRDFTQALPYFLKVFAHPPAPPLPFDYKTIDPSFEVYGWNVAIQRPDREFAELRDAGPAGFKLLGSGTATVTTGRYFAPGQHVTATTDTVDGSSTLTAIADSAGRITLKVPIGPPNTYDEYSPQAEAADAAYGAQMQAGYYNAGSPGTAVYTAHVTFSPAGVAR